jgi:hypothetical protein
VSRRLIKKEALPAFIKRGVPHSVLLSSHPENIQRFMSTIELPKRGDEPIIHDKTKQFEALEGFKKVLAQDIRSNERLLLISARDYDHLPNQLALSLAAYAFEHHREFVWHSLYGGYSDELRDDKTASDERLKKCSLLVLSNLAENSTAIKVEKARDLLNRYSHLNRIVVTAGMNPVEYAKTVLHMRPDALISF